MHQQRQHHQPGDDVGAVVDTADLAHARADGRAEHHKIQAGGDHRRQHTLHDGAFHARHLELVDCFYTVQIHYALHSYQRLFVHQANKYFFQRAFPGLQIPVFNTQIPKGTEQAGNAGLLLLGVEGIDQLVAVV